MSDDRPASETARSPEIAAHADSALRTVRWVLGVLSCFVLGAYRPLTGGSAWGSLTLTLLVVMGTVFALNLLSLRMPRHSLGWAAFAQTLDVVAIVGLVILLDGPLGNEAWVLLVVPVVSASVRMGAAASLLSWAVGSFAYIVAVKAGVLAQPDDLSHFVRVPGALLAVAITTGILARWMREGWEIQNDLTEAITAREHRLAVIEQSGRALKNLSTDEALEVCANQIIALGFEAATVQYPDGVQPQIAVGHCEIVAEAAATVQPTASEGLVTSWTEDDRIRVHSAAILERHSGVVVTGWSPEPVDEDQAQALAMLVAHTSNEIEASSLLGRLRHSAAHDPLTGLANRRTFDQQLNVECRKTGRLVVAFIDLDHFKEINDGQGHLVGDQALTAISRRLESIVGSSGLIARYGGDEFVILLPEAGLDDGRRAAQAMLDTTRDPIAVNQITLSVGLSIGIAAGTTPRTATDLIRAADQAAYRAKTDGRGRMVAVDVDEASAPVATTIA
jgi:diguanylate cyclase (GGDEF)-like protein